MWSDHVPRLTRHGKRDAKGLADLITFALVSIRQPFARVPEMLKDVRHNGARSSYLWGFKAEGYRAAHGDIGRECFERLAGIAYSDKAVETLLAIPGLGIAKAGFVASMLGYDVGCLDSRNLSRYKIPRRAFRDDTKQGKKIPFYIDLCRQLGGAEILWDEWCKDFAKESADFYSPQQVSAMHLAAIR